MEIIIKLKSGRQVRVVVPEGTALSSTQLDIMVQWAIAGKSAEVMLD